MLARIIEPTSKQAWLRVLEEAGVDAASYPTLNRRLPAYANDSWRRGVAAACAAHAALGPASLVLYDVSTLCFETDTGDGFREPGFSKERRLGPQSTVGLLTDATGFPLMIEAFEGNKAETRTMLPVITAFMAAHQLTDVTVVADAGMISEASQHERRTPRPHCGPRRLSQQRVSPEGHMGTPLVGRIPASPWQPLPTVRAAASARCTPLASSGRDPQPIKASQLAAEQ